MCRRAFTVRSMRDSKELLVRCHAETVLLFITFDMNYSVAKSHRQSIYCLSLVKREHWCTFRTSKTSPESQF